MPSFHNRREKRNEFPQFDRLLRGFVFKLNWKTDERTQCLSHQTDRLCWTGCKSGFETSLSNVTRVRDSIRLLFDRIQSGEEFMGLLGPNFISFLL